MKINWLLLTLQENSPLEMHVLKTKITTDRRHRVLLSVKSVFRSMLSPRMNRLISELSNRLCEQRKNQSPKKESSINSITDNQ